MKETQLVNALKEYLSWRGHFVWRNNSGAMTLTSVNKAGQKKSRFFRAGIKGSSDIIGIAKDGKFIAIEAKVGKNKPTELQRQFLEEITSRGGYGVVAYSIEDVEKAGL